MNRGIFLGNQKQIEYVFPADIQQELLTRCDVSKRVYSKEEVVNAPEQFRDVRYIFSTWGMPVFTEEEIRACFPDLKCVFYAAGSVQFFARPFLNCGMQVFSSWAANAVPVAEYTVAQIILANKGFYQNQLYYKRGEHTKAAAHFHAHTGNYRMKVGLIGVGMIGTMVAERLQNFSAEVLVYDPFLSDEKAALLHVRKVTLETLFEECDVVSNHLANNAQTQNMLTASLFEKMKPYATFLNTGRGAQVNENDLSNFLKARPDCTAVLDVTVNEPLPPDHALYSCENCFITTHIAGSAGNEVWRMAEYMLDELCRYESGEETLYSVTLKMLETMA